MDQVAERQRSGGVSRGGGGARERLLEAAYDLFSHHGVQSVGVDRVIAEANVAKATLYHHFPSKQYLVLAFLQLREERWTYGWLAAEVERRADDPRERLLAVFDALDEWIAREDFEGCPFIKALVEIPDPADPIHAAAVAHMRVTARLLSGYAEDAGLEDADLLAQQLQLLMTGTIVQGMRGEGDPAPKARGVAELVIGRSAPAPV